MFDKFDLKKEFQQHLYRKLDVNYDLKFLLLQIFVHGTAFILGGYLRDFLNKKDSRDIDILVDISHDKLLEIIESACINHSINRYNGIKLHLENLDVDMWSINNNWAFKNELVKLNEAEKITSIAKGCFYNYDSLVINLHNYNYSINNYKSFIEKNKLDILQKTPKYKLLNPTINANILRAFYLRYRFDCSYSDNTKYYLLSKIGELKDSKGDYVLPLIETRNNYPKYKEVLTIQDIEFFINELYQDNKYEKQYYLKI